MHQSYDRQLGANLVSSGVEFGVWAPLANSVDVLLEANGDASVHSLEQFDSGVFAAVVPGVSAGNRYRFSVNSGPGLPDPRSRFQPEGVHGPSEVVDLSQFAWSDGNWPGLHPANLSIYELHIGTYTPEGMFSSLTAQLQSIKALGVNAIEIMPVADFPGKWNWGYDGVAWFAPSRVYGPPETLQRLVDSAHTVGLGVILDVVYNHFGPDGNYTGAYSDQYTTDRHMTPWGEAINYDGEGSRFVRDFVIDNAVQWVRDYHFDGLRLDASDTIVDDSTVHILRELQQHVRDSTDRNVVIIAEEARNSVTTIRPTSKGGYGMDAVWADDFHHELRVLLSNAWENYYADYTGSMTSLCKAINEGFFYQGQVSRYRGAQHGTEVTNEPASAFLFAIQNHDQVGNRPFGERLHQQIDAERYRVTSTLLMLVPETILLFMGQEFAATTPFLYFTDHNPELGKLVTEGRRSEFGGFREFADEGSVDLIPDPQDPGTFGASKLNLSERHLHQKTYALYRELLRLRNEDPVFRHADRQSCLATPLGAKALSVHRWQGGSHRLLIANFGADATFLLKRKPDVTFELAEELLTTQSTELGGDGLDCKVFQDEKQLWVEVPARTALLLGYSEPAM